MVVVKEDNRLRKETRCRSWWFSAFLFPFCSFAVVSASIALGVVLQQMERGYENPDVLYAGFSPPAYSKEVIESLRGKTLTNLDEVAASINYTNFEISPYPNDLGYDTHIDTSKNCYVAFESASNRSFYSLHSLTPKEAEARNVTAKNIFLTHENHCGVCSSLDDLALYLEKPDMTEPVRKCGFRLIKKRGVACLQSLGFSHACSWAWFWNTRSTRKNCLPVCLRYITAPNNMPTKGRNYCEPQYCENTINGQPACSNSSWKRGYYRLNPCISCDECRSGPVFKRTAGRTRRASGAPSAIRRDPSLVAEVTHFYGSPSVEWDDTNAR